MIQTRIEELLSRLAQSLGDLTEDVHELARRGRAADRDTREEIDELRKETRAKLEAIATAVTALVAAQRPAPPLLPGTVKREEDDTKPFMLTHGDGTYVRAESLALIGKWIAKHLWWVLPSGGLGWLTHYVLDVLQRR